MSRVEASVSKEELPEFKKEYEKALEDGKENFIWKGSEVFTGYAKYLIEYLE